MTAFRISDIRFKPSRSIDESGGLLGWTAFILNDDLRVSSVAVRRTRRGSITLSFPTRKDGQGIAHPIVIPTTHAAHKAIERVVLAELRALGAVR
jgi:DNA-binding cell septation regulator SpoVG